ncbi:T9SS sorting signal type C domain-containing protein [Flavobacterium sp. F52]|uniref:T9SS sorting signal type C domain-containing protein n=1 Tax=Flavobacterium sp. F52 TaxID=1202532 RepID=UPI00027301F9|nr:T9SS sorting signal type C domain-containing protein [Flavobacterium sp. F52]EJG01582.1 hypothetical protein FF52_10998 [Flavobacterium sp. F52]
MMRKLLYSFLFFIFLHSLGFGQTRTWTGNSNSNWNNSLNWTPNSVPTSTDDVIIPNGTPDVSVNTNAFCKSLTINGGNSSDTVLISGTNSLTVSNTITIGAGTTAGGYKILNVGNGSLSCAGITMSSTSNTNRNSSLRISNGTVTVSGSVTLNTNNEVLFSGTGILYIGGTMTGGILTAPSGTVNYNTNGSQNIGGPYTYNNLTLSNGGTKTLTAATVANGAITLNDNSSLNMSTYLLTLNGNLVNNGSGTITGTTGGVTISGGNTQNIAGFTTSGTVLMNKTGGTVATFTGNVNGGNLTISGSTTATALNLGSNLVHTFTGNWTRTSGALNGGSSTLKIGGDVSGTGGTFTANTSTVEFNRSGAQNLGSGNLTYYNLILSGSGLKTFGAATTVSNLWSIATGVQAALGSYVHSAAILTLGGAGPLTASWGSTSSNPSANNTNDTFFATGSGNTGRINITQTPPGSAIDNNYASYSVSNGMSGDIAGTSGEYANPPTNSLPGSLTLTAPAGTVFINVKFASYGSPGGTSPNFTIGSCHAFNSRTVTTTLLGNTTATIPSSGNTFNSTFGDPCYGIVKSYNVVATYSTPICAGTNPGTITGSTPTGGNGPYSYLWEVSTTSATSGYSVAPGVSNGKDYDIPAGITVATWYRRTVTSGIYSDATIVVIPVNIPGQLSAPTSASASSNSVCAGTAVTLTVTGGTSGTNKGGYAEWTSGTCNGPVVGRSTLLNGSITITPIADTNYFVKYKNACGETTCNVTAVTVTNPTSITLDSATSTRTICSPSSATNLSLGYMATKGAPTSYSIVWSTAAISAGFSNRTDIAFTAAASNGPGTISNAFNVPANVAAGTYTATLTVKTGSCVSFGNAITITINPRPTATISGTTTICSGANTPIAVSFTGTAPWNFSYSYGGTSGTFSTSSNPYIVNVNPTNSTTYSITALSDGTGCNAIAGDITGTATITVNTAPSITTQPSAQAICLGSNTTFGVVASGTGLTYKWQVSTNGGVSFSDLSDSGVYSNTTTATMSITGATAGMNNYRYQVVITGTCAPAVTSNAVVLTVNTAPSITTQPSAQAICSGSNTTFGVAASGSGLTYKWQVSTNGGVSFSDLSDSGVYSNTTTATMSITGATAGMNNYRYRAVVNGTCSPLATSNAVVLTVNPIPTTPSITKNTDVSCGSFGSITLTGLSGNWTINQTGGMGPRSFNGTSATHPIQDLTAGTHYFTVTNNATGCTSNIASITINDVTIDTEWDGSGWTNGTPDGNKRVTISSIGSIQPFSALAQTNIDACSLIITAGADVTVPSGVTLNITNAITSNGKLVFESGSSLLQGKDAVNTGDIIYKRAVNLSRYDVVYWSTPLTKNGFTMHDLSPNTLYDKYFYWNARDGKWVYNTNGTEPMKRGEGYNIRAPQNHDIVSPSLFTGVFTGVPNNGDINVTVELNKWNFLGNPYPSAIDADELILDTNKDVLGSLYFWTHSQAPQIIPGTNTYRYISSDYLVYNGVGSTRVNNPSSPSDEFKGYIAAGQGFFAKPTVSQIKFNNDLRRGSSENTQFYKTAKTKKIEKNRLWLNAANSQGAFKQMLIGYVEGATNAIDVSYDAVTMGSNSYVDLYSINDSKKLTIQGRALPFDNTEVIPLGFKCGIDATGDRTFTISIDHADGFFNTQEVYLEDKELGVIKDLRKENYTFTSGTGTYSNRFVLRYTNKTLGTGEFENLENTVLVSVKDKAINITSSKEIIKGVNVYNIGVELLYSNSKVNASQLQIKNLHSSDQVLLVKITLENGHTFSKKVIFSNL